MRPLPARLPVARRPARCLLRPPDGQWRHATDDLRPLVRLLHRPDREKAAQPLLPRQQHPLLRHRRLQPRLQVLPELGHLQVEGHGSTDGRSQPADDRRRRQALRRRQPSPTPTTTRSSSPNTPSTPRSPAASRASATSRSPPAIFTASRRRNSSPSWMPPTSTSRLLPTSSITSSASAICSRCSISWPTSTTKPIAGWKSRRC